MSTKARYLTCAITAVLSFAILTPAQAGPIRELDLVGVQVVERSGSSLVAFNMIPDLPLGTVITEKRAGRLSFANRDYLSNANEYYDFFYSDADGTFNIDGAFLTVTAIFDTASDSGLNVSGALLIFSTGHIEFANVVTAFTALGTSPDPTSVSNALGDTPDTHTFLGDTSDHPNDDVRLSITLGFESTRPPTSPVPEPSSIALLITGGLCLIGFRRRRKAA